jgi:hypothetical protein
MQCHVSTKGALLQYIVACGVGELRPHIHVRVVSKDKMAAMKAAALYNIEIQTRGYQQHDYYRLNITFM